MTGRNALLLALVALIPMSAQATPPAPRTLVVSIAKMKFGAIPAGLRRGDAILWINRDIFRHTATATGLFDVDLEPGAQAKSVLTASGKFTVKCKYHPGMSASLAIAG